MITLFVDFFRELKELVLEAMLLMLQLERGVFVNDIFLVIKIKNGDAVGIIFKKQW